jgi:hypothetical protein
MLSSTEDIQDAELASLGRRIDRVASRLYRLERCLQRRKFRVPSVCKTLGSPSQARDFITSAATAFRCGGSDALRRFARKEQVAGRLE